MKSTLRSLALVGWAVMLAGSGLALAQQEDRPDDRDRIEGVEQAEEEEAKPGDREGRRMKPREMMSVPELIAKLNKLRKTMDEHLDLSRKQEEAVDELFEFQLESLEQTPSKQKTAKDLENELEAVQGLQQELIEARKTGDRERARDIRRQMSEKLRQRRSGSALPLGRFVKKVGSELNEAQLDKYHAIVKRLGLKDALRERGFPIQRLMGAVFASDVGLSREQSRTVRRIVSEHMASIDTRDMGKEERDESVAKLRDKIFEELTPEQREAVEAKLEEMKRKGQRKHGGWKRGDAEREDTGEQSEDENESENESESED